MTAVISLLDSGRSRDLTAFTDADEAVARIAEIYAASADLIRRRFAAHVAGKPLPGHDVGPACYPWLGIELDQADIPPESELSFGHLDRPGLYGTTLTRPDIFARYYREQITLLLENHRKPVWVGVSSVPIPVPFVVREADRGITAEEMRALQAVFPMPDLAKIEDRVPNGVALNSPAAQKPLALFTGQRVDFSLVRLKHYTGTSPEHFQGYVLFTNYQRYVDEFVEYGLTQVAAGKCAAFIEPGDIVTTAARKPDRHSRGRLPQMPAYHLVQKDGQGITLINIGVGPSNAKTITDHIAVLRPHCWLMVGHCGGLRGSQRLGDYVLAHAYVRADHVLDDYLPPIVPIPTIAEVQVALQEAAALVTGLNGRRIKTHLRTGTVFTTDDRDWELRLDDLAILFNQTRAIAIDMESATIAANGFRFRVPYGTLLCVSDKPLNGELKLPGMANAFYEAQVSQHLQIGIETCRLLAERGAESLHSRKLRSFDEPAFR